MYIRVEVHPGAKRTLIKKIADGNFLITVKEPAEQNLANYRVRELIAVEYGADVKKLRMISGHHSQRKILSLEEN